jgi:hypothetical protein
MGQRQTIIHSTGGAIVRLARVHDHLFCQLVWLTHRKAPFRMIDCATLYSNTDSLANETEVPGSGATRP